MSQADQPPNLNDSNQNGNPIVSIISSSENIDEVSTNDGVQNDPNDRAANFVGTTTDISKRTLFKFQDAWLAPDDTHEQERMLPRWREWLSRVPFNPNAAFCNFCKQEIILCNIGRNPISRHARGNKHKEMSTRNTPTISDDETVRSNSLINADTGRKRGSSTLEKNASSQSKRDRQGNNSGNEFQEAWLDPVDPQEQEQRWPRWREWLSRAPFIPNAAYCKFCRKEISLYPSGRGHISNHARCSKKHKKKLSKRNVPTISDGETVRSNSLINADNGRKRGSSTTLEKNASMESKSKRDRRSSQSGSSTSKTSRDLPAPQAQSESRQDGLPPLSDVSVVLEHLPSVERQNASNSSVQPAAGNGAIQRDSSTSNASKNNHQQYDLPHSTHVGYAATTRPPRGPRIESVFSINREVTDANAVEVHRQCNEKQRATECQLHEIKDKYITALEMNGQQANQIRELEFQIAALSQRNQELEAQSAASTVPIEVVDIKDDLSE